MFKMCFKTTTKYDITLFHRLFAGFFLPGAVKICSQKNPTLFCRLYLVWSQSLYTSAHFVWIYLVTFVSVFMLSLILCLCSYGFHLLGGLVITIIITTIKYYEICALHFFIAWFWTFYRFIFRFFSPFNADGVAVAL